MRDTRPSSVLVYLDALRRHWALSLFSFSMVLALVVPFAMGLPDMYRASATIIVEGQLFDTLGPGSAEIDSRLQAIKQESLSRARLTELIEQFNLYAESRKESSIGEALGRTQRDIQIEITSTSQRSGQANTIAFKLSYVGSDPTTVAKVTNGLASFYVAQNDKLRSRVVAYKTERLEDSLADAKKKLDSQERRLAVFRNQNMGALPQQFDANQAALTRISVEIQGNTSEQIRQRERRQTLLNQIFDVTHTGADESDLQLQLAKRTKELADLRLNETADSPNVRTKEREIDALTSQIASHGLYAVFVLMTIDAVFPAASELVMVYGGALASGALARELDVFGSHQTGVGAYLAIALAGIAGYQLGSIAGWWIGERGGRPLLERRGKWFHLTPKRLDSADRWFERWGDWAVLVGRVTPVARSFVSIPAGVFEVPFPRYNVLTLLGNAVWCFALAGAGWALGRSWDTFHHDFRYADYVVAAAIVAAAVYWFLRRRRAATMPRRDPAR